VHSPAFINHAMSGVTGSHHPRTSWNHISQFTLPAHSKDERHGIADLLCQVHALLLICETACDTAGNIKQTAIASLFTHGLRGEARKETEFGLIPRTWESLRVGSLAAVKGGKRMPKGVSLTAEDTGRPYIRVTDLQHNSVRTSGLLFVPIGYEQHISRYRISHRDVYISIAGTIGVVGQVPSCLDDANLTENAAKLVPVSDRVVPTFLMYALSSQPAQQQIAQATARNAQPKLALTRIEQIRLPIPPTLAEQQEIVEVLRTIDCKIELHRQKRAVLEDLFKALLHKLMTGEIDVNDLDLQALSAHEPATEGSPA